jgi:hypothetical protein
MLAPRTTALIMRAREHPAGRYALKLFSEQRRATVLADNGADARTSLT